MEHTAGIGSKREEFPMQNTKRIPKKETLVISSKVERPNAPQCKENLTLQQE
jgi:hypothetical protein